MLVNKLGALQKSGWLSRNMQISRVVGYCHTSISFITVPNLWWDLLVVLPPFHFWFELRFTWFVILEWPKGASINTLVYFLKNIYQLLVSIQVALSTTNRSTPAGFKFGLLFFDLAAKISLEFNLVGAASPPMALNTTTGPWAWTQW
jgi:hypothetical protein